MRGGSRHVPARPGRAAGRSPARKPGKASAKRGDAATDSASGPAAPGGREAAPAVAPDTDKIIRVAEPVVHALGMDLESVKVTTAGRRRLLRMVVDSDGGVSLDDAALASRELSVKLDASDVMGDMPYTLEVSSPGVDRPLTEPRHWQRAVGRLVRVPLTAGAGQAKSAAASGHRQGDRGHGRGKARRGPGQVWSRQVRGRGGWCRSGPGGGRRRGWGHPGDQRRTAPVRVRGPGCRRGSDRIRPAGGCAGHGDVTGRPGAGITGTGSRARWTLTSAHSGCWRVRKTSRWTPR